MTTPALPYFFDEALSASTAALLGERETELGFTLDDLDWLNTVYKPTQAARKAHEKPMQAFQLLLSLPGKAGIPLAGAFAMSPCETLPIGKLFSRRSCSQRWASTSRTLGPSSSMVVR